VDLDLFYRHMDPQNGQMGALLKGHLWVEARLNRALELSLTDATALDLDRMSFAAKIDLCLAVGALEEVDAHWLRALNRERNRLAHRLDAEPETDLVPRLLGVSSQPVRRAYEAMGREPANDLTGWFVAALMHLEYGNLMRDYRRTNKRVLDEYYVTMATYELLGKTSKSDEEARRELGVPEPPTIVTSGLALLDPRRLTSQTQTTSVSQERSLAVASHPGERPPLA
jgi:hypothetical protein